jgi:hypothetical protein
VKLSGLIYLHRISDNRLAGSALRNLRMFKELCGEDAYKHIVLATSMWAKEDLDTAARREQELVGEGGFWAAMKKRGSTVMRWHGDSSSADAIIHRLLEARDQHGAVSLKIQRELVDEGKTLVDTSAGQEVDRELAELREKLEGELRRIQQENREAMTSKDHEWQESLVEQRLLLERQRRLAEESQEALKVDFERLLAETEAKYRQELESIRGDLHMAGEAMQNAREVCEQKDREVKALQAQMRSAKTPEEQQEIQEKLMQELAGIQEARLKEEKLRQETEEKKAKHNKIVLWLKSVGALVIPVLVTIATAGIQS